MTKTPNTSLAELGHSINASNPPGSGREARILMHPQTK